METFIVLIFAIGYLAITIEHTIKIDKLIPSLLMMALAWAAIAFGLDGFTTWFDSHNGSLIDISSSDHDSKLHLLESTLLHHFGKTSEILIFLVGAMTIVEIIDQFNGFQTIKKLIKTRKKTTLLWIISILAFFLSAIIDNLTTTIVLITILRKIVHEQNSRMWYASIIVIAANAGGAWSPIGDVTTTMLWMNNKVSSIALIEHLFIPSVLCVLLPLIVGNFLPAFKGEVAEEVADSEKKQANKYGPFMLTLGLIMIVFVPIFKTITHLPPYMGMMLSLAVVAIAAEILSNRSFSMSNVQGHHGGGHGQAPTLKALSKIEMPSVLFFLGILMTVAALESLGLIFSFGKDVNALIPEDLFVTLLGVASAVIDNVPLVAASMGMFQEAMDAPVWHFIAYAAGTGGSMLIIGSAAGVVAMGMEKISFGWYLKNISWLALIGYVAGIIWIVLM